MNEFKIRAYGRMELAQLYSPELTDIAAYRKMKKWISLCPGLLQRLYDLGYESKRRSFTPLEVRVIVDALGELSYTAMGRHINKPLIVSK